MLVKDFSQIKASVRARVPSVHQQQSRAIVARRVQSHTVSVVGNARNQIVESVVKGVRNLMNSVIVAKLVNP